MREALLKRLADWHASYPGRMLLLVLLLTIGFGILAGHLKVTMRWSDLLPAKDRRTLQFNRIIDEFVSATSLVVVVQGEEAKIKAFAEVLAPRILECQIENESGEAKSLFRRVDYKAEVDFLKQHGFMLVKAVDLRDIKDMFTDPNLTGFLTNLNNSLEKEYVGQEESISTREKEDRAVIFLDGIEDFINKLKQTVDNQNVSETQLHALADKLLIGEPFFLSYDESALILNAIPNFTMMDLGLVEDGTNAVQEIIDELSVEYPGVEAGLTGFIAIGRDEMVYSEQSLGYTTVIAVVAILLLLIFSFRMWVAPILAILNLIVGLIWAIGTATLVVGQLNIMTQMMAVILLGLGIDFSIHLISGFTEWRALGDSISESLEKTFLKNGKGIITGAFTTACAFFALAISHSRGMKEMGLVTGSGLLAILLTTFLFLPALLVMRERRLETKQAKTAPKSIRVQRDISFRFLGKAAEWLGRHFAFTLVCALGISVVLIWYGRRIGFDHNYMNIEPKGITSVVLQETVLEKFDLSMDYALVLADSVDESRDLADEYRDLGSVAVTEDISQFLPSLAQQNKRLPYVEEIQQQMKSAQPRDLFVVQELQDFKSELERLEMNIMEMQDMAFLGGQDKVDNKCLKIVGDPENPNAGNIIQDLHATLTSEEDKLLKNLSWFQQIFAPYFQEVVLNMCSTDPILMQDLPVSILDRFSNIRRDQFLVTVFPAASVWHDAEFLKRFAQDLEEVSDRATGMPSVFQALIEVIGQDGRNAVILTLGIVFLLLWFDFRSPWYALMAMIPLAAGIFWMVGFMHLVGMQLTVMNVMGLPLIVGIGIDDGVHIVHRLRIEGRGKLGVIFSSTGKAILLTSLTTMLAFGSLVFAIWRGFGQLGSALFLGVAACFLTTVIFLSGLIGLRDRRNSQ